MAGFDVKTLLWSMSVLVVLFCAKTTEAAGNDDEKHDYTIDIARIQSREISATMLGKDSYFADSLVDDSTVINAILDFKKDIPESVVSLIGFELNAQTNQWVEKFRQSHPFCEFIEKNTYFVDNVYKDSDLPRACPLKKGKYFIRNMVIDNKEFPKHLKEASWRVDVDLIVKATREPVVMISVYADIVPVVEE